MHNDSIDKLHKQDLSQAVLSLQSKLDETDNKANLSDTITKLSSEYLYLLISTTANVNTLYKISYLGVTMLGKSPVVKTRMSGHCRHSL